MESSEAFRLRYAQAIRDARLVLGLDQADFAVMAGVGLRTVQGWEAGRNLPQPHHREKLDRIIEHAQAKADALANAGQVG